MPFLSSTPSLEKKDKRDKMTEVTARAHQLIDKVLLDVKVLEVENQWDLQQQQTITNMLAECVFLHLSLELF
jgi:hypothetical protein